METDKRAIERMKRKAQQQRARKMKVLRMRLLLAGILLVALLAILLIIKAFVGAREEEERQEQLISARKHRAELIQDNTLRLLAVGDNIIHEPILEAGKSEGDWNYDFLYEQISPLIQEADLAVVNQETIFIADHEKTAGYPLFGSPTEVGDALVDAGFDVVQHATNHAYDMGDQGIIDTLDFWRNQYPEITLLGIHKTQEEANQIVIKEIKNFKLALLNYTQYINYDGLPEEKSYLVDLLKEEKVKADVSEAKAQADFVICFLHAGQEDSEEPDENMEKWVSFLADQGVDLLIGTHPHVLQSCKMIERKDGGQMLTYYSLGNFASTQKTVNGLLGGMADIKLCKDWNTGEVTIDFYQTIPTIMHYNHDKSEYCVYALSDYTEDLAAQHGIREETQEVFTVRKLQSIVEDRVKQ